MLEKTPPINQYERLTLNVHNLYVVTKTYKILNKKCMK